jgi:moderate conductance mechanosensitive channel
LPVLLYLFFVIRKFQEAGIEIASTVQTILMQLPQPAEAAVEARPRRAAG